MYAEFLKMSYFKEQSFWLLTESSNKLVPSCFFYKLDRSAVSCALMLTPFRMLPSLCLPLCISEDVNYGKFCD